VIGCRFTFILSAVVTVLIAVGTASSASATLTPDQVAILANRNSQDSLDVARHYARKRGVPTNHVIELDLPFEETISRKEYEDRVLRPVRHALVNRQLAPKIRALATIYGTPLLIEASQPSSEQGRWLKDTSERRRYAESHLLRIEESITRIAPSGEPDTSEKAGNSAIGTDQSLEIRLEKAVQSAIVRLKQVQDRKQADQWKAELTRLARIVGGPAALINHLVPAPTADPARTQADIENLRRQVASTRQMIQALTDSPSDANRQRAYKLVEQVFGLLGILRLAILETDLFTQKDSDASLDSELSFLWWDFDFYPLAGRLTNPLYHDLRPPGSAPTPLVPVLMVSRLDAPSPEQAKHVVDQAFVAEQRGLSGKIYVDARGLKPEPASVYGQYDQNLRDVATLFRNRTPYEVVLEDTDRRFSQAGEAPDVAVYVGWYKLRAYEDAFTFLPGAIGYHIASGEAISLHDALERGWCKNALERGITVTLGSVGEPYVDAFPLPSEFIGLLLTGRYSLVEAYYLTSRYISWRMVLVGDPLYNPWRGKNLVGEKDLGLRAGSPGPGKLPLPPSEGPFPNPISAGKQAREQRQALSAKVDEILGQIEKQGSRSRPSGP